MSIEQTSQLLQLILNSMLLILGCILLLSQFSMRRTGIEEQWQNLVRQGAELRELENRGWARGHFAGAENRLLQVKKQLRQMQQRYQTLHLGCLAVHYALGLAIGSALTLALRTLLPLDWLIPLSLSLFVISVVVLLWSVVLILVDLHKTDRPLREELTDHLSLHREEPTRPSSRPRRSPAPDHRARAVVSSSRSRSSLKARVG